MSWVLIIVGAVLIAMGVEAVVLSRSRVHLPQREIDKLVHGSPPPTLSHAARSYLESRFVVSNGSSTQVLGVVFVILGLVVGAIGVGLLL